jgi:uncharacterized protein (TIGR00297 family)
MSGTVAAFMMALVFIRAGLATFVLPMLLLIGGTLLTRLNRETSEKHGRNARQVLANGAIGTCCLLYYMITGGSGQEHPFFLAYLVSFSVSISDTFSSESGKYFRGKTVDITGLKTIKPGLSGGVSIQGTLGGLAGSALSAILAHLCFGLSFYSALLVCALGFLGMLLDSVLGSVMQAKYINAEGAVAEYPSADNHLVRGYAWCRNDAVNVLSNLLAVSGYLINS